MVELEKVEEMLCVGPLLVHPAAPRLCNLGCRPRWHKACRRPWSWGLSCPFGPLFFTNSRDADTPVNLYGDDIAAHSRPIETSPTTAHYYPPSAQKRHTFDILILRIRARLMDNPLCLPRRCKNMQTLRILLSDNH